MIFHKTIRFAKIVVGAITLSNLSNSRMLVQNSPTTNDSKTYENHFCNAYTTLVHNGNFEFKKSSALVYT